MKRTPDQKSINERFPCGESITSGIPDKVSVMKKIPDNPGKESITERIPENKKNPAADVVIEKLKELADDRYREFISSLTPNAGNILGVRLPLLRRLGSGIARGDWRSYLAAAGCEYFEEIMLRGIVIGLVKTGIEEKLELVASFVPEINNWAVCDSFCSGLRFAEKNKARVWDFLQGYFRSDREFDVRFAVVMLMDYFIDEEHIGQVLELLDGVRHEGYYARMAVAWALSSCYAAFPGRTTAYLEKCALDDFTYNKALQKIIESNRTDEKIKEIMRRMKRKAGVAKHE